jgi:hypothetical protein
LVSTKLPAKPALRRGKSTSHLDEEVELADEGFVFSDDEEDDKVSDDEDDKASDDDKDSDDQEDVAEELDENDPFSTYREMTGKELKTAFKDPQTIKEVLGVKKSMSALVVPLLTVFADKVLLVAGTKRLTVAHLTIFRRYFGLGPDPSMKKADLVDFLAQKLAAQASE